MAGAGVRQWRVALTEQVFLQDVGFVRGVQETDHPLILAHNCRVMWKESLTFFDAEDEVLIIFNLSHVIAWYEVNADASQRGRSEAVEDQEPQDEESAGKLRL